GLIWVEFTKTSPNIVKKASPAYTRRGSFHSLEARKTDRDVEYYFYRANGLQPIRSSIPGAFRNAELRAEQAEKSAGRAFAGIGIIAILALVVALFQLFAQMNGNLQTTVNLAGTISTNADRAKADAAQALVDAQAVKRDLESAREEIETLR